jgi:hypothetical protein
MPHITAIYRDPQQVNAAHHGKNITGVDLKLITGVDHGIVQKIERCAPDSNN